MLDKAERQMKAGQLARAYHSLQQAGRLARRANMERQVERALSKLAKAAAEVLTEANEHYELREYDPAMQKYKMISALRRLRVGQTARKSLEKLRRDPERRGHEQEMKAARVFEEVQVLMTQLLGGEDPEPMEEGDSPLNPSEAYLASADEGERSSHSMDLRVEIVNLLDKITRLYPTTPTGEEASIMLSDMLADRVLLDEVDRRNALESARQKLHMAKAYLKIDDQTKADELLSQVLNEAPGTEWADEARELLAAER